MKSLQNFNTFILENKNKNVFSALKGIHGLNLKKINKIALITGVDSFERVSSVNFELFLLIKKQASFFYNLEENKIFNNVNKKKKLKNYIGMRHILKLPVRGQRTHTNAKTPSKNIKKEL
jgi:small subunit ribosomal protein S13|uniref:Ribosomal protein S13 n=1 Tax=Acanthamoeba polyphaga TaxID=5757 RepID=A0A0S0ILH3_ACAPO|nr:ribosomal protein S13 [Acanthamoeba polyphaga]